MKKSLVDVISDSTIKGNQRGTENLTLGSLFICVLIIYSMQPIHAQNNPSNTVNSGKSDNPGTVTLFLSGDVMTGRGIDQILPHPCKPVIYEPYMKSARGYVEIAEKENGPIPDPVAFSYIWGDALEVLEQREPDICLINLETSITDSDTYWKGKQIHYRMHPENTPCLTTAKIDICVLANNHVLDWGYEGLSETIRTLSKRSIQNTGAGKNISEAEKPAIYPISFPQGADTAHGDANTLRKYNTPGRKGRVVVFSYGLGTSGIPPTWAAGEELPGVNSLPDSSGSTVRVVKDRIEEVKRPGDIVVFSVHWGGNWGYTVPREHTWFAHRLIDDAGVDIIHGHSSHHALGIEVYQKKLILYGCGDFLNDYEGIGGYEQYRDDLPLMYLPRVDPTSGDLVSMEIVPFQIRNFRLNRAKEADVEWIERTLDREGNRFGTGVTSDGAGVLMLTW